MLKNYDKVKTVEEFAELGGYTATTFRRIFTSVFHQPVYEWMQERRKEGILYELRHTDFTISVISMALNLCLISLISVRRILDCLLAA